MAQALTGILSTRSSSGVCNNKRAIESSGIIRFPHGQKTHDRIRDSHSPNHFIGGVWSRALVCRFALRAPSGAVLCLVYHGTVHRPTQRSHGSATGSEDNHCQFLVVHRRVFYRLHRLWCLGQFIRAMVIPLLGLFAKDRRRADYPVWAVCDGGIQLRFSIS